MSSLIPDDYLPFLDYLPDLHKCVNVFMTFTPLFSYGSTCLSIYNKQTSLGFSIDICATMLMASILRIFYYLVSPYEVTLLRQSIIMIFIQIVLLRISLFYRPVNYDPEFLTQMPVFKHELNNHLPRRLSASNPQYHESYYIDNSYVRSWYRLVVDAFFVAQSYVIIIFRHALNFFDIYYRRPYTFWQWKEEHHYWKFIVLFAGVFGATTLFLYSIPVYGSFIGILGLFIESLLPLPQILLLNRLQSIKNFKIILLLSWLGGDLTKLSYLLYGTKDISVIFILAGLFQMGLDLVIAFQYIKLRYLEDSEPETIESDYELKSLA